MQVSMLLRPPKPLFLASHAIIHVPPVETIVVFYMVDLMQRGQMISERNAVSADSTAAGLAIGALPFQQPTAHGGIDLHSLGNMFLGPISRKLFDMAVMLHFLSILISYVLAGSEAYSQLIGVPLTTMIAPFFLFWTTVIVLMARQIAPIISVVTFIKGTLLIVMIGVVGVLADMVSVSFKDDWRFLGSPFLLGTVALGGVVNTMPVMFTKVVQDFGMSRAAVTAMRNGVLAGVVVCFACNSVWCFFVLNIVPQQGYPVSLEESRDNGEISTVPVINIMRSQAPVYAWMAVMVEAFIAISISVSYVTMGSGLKHFLDGIAVSVTGTEQADDESANQEGGRVGLCCRITSTLSKLTSVQASFVLYAFSFGFVCLMALNDPKAFLVVLEVSRVHSSPC
jgi:hypothetical protein